jgi:hypothetical protein
LPGASGHPEIANPPFRRVKIGPVLAEAAGASRRDWVAAEPGYPPADKAIISWPASHHRHPGHPEA